MDLSSPKPNSAPVASGPLGLVPHAKELRLRAFELYKRGLPLSEIGAELNISPATVRSWSLRGKWPEAKKLSLSKPEASGETVLDLAQRQGDELDIPSGLQQQAARYEENMAHHAIRLSERVKTMDIDSAISKADKISKLDAVARKTLRIERVSQPNFVIQLGVLCGKALPADAPRR